MKEAEVAAFIAEFEACRLPKSRWTHHAHLIAGFWYASKYPLEQALPLIRERIKAHNQSVGTANTDSSGYHETITRLYLTAIAEHITQHPLLGFEESLMLVLLSPLSDSQWPLRYYSKERLFSVEARRGWVEPET